MLVEVEVLLLMKIWQDLMMLTGLLVQTDCCYAYLHYSVREKKDIEHCRIVFSSSLCIDKTVKRK